MRLRQIIPTLLGLFFYSTSLLAQLGPGGVSVEVDDWESLNGQFSGNQSSCRLWLDASSLTHLADGDGVEVWVDESLSHVVDSAVVVNSELPPFFRDDPANSINGYPVVTFEENRFFQMGTSIDLNQEAITYAKTIFFAFRTSTDVNSKQMLYEEGGCMRGLNTYIENGQIIFGAYDLNEGGMFNTGDGGPNDNGTDPDNTPQWGYTYVSTGIQANTTYVLALQYSAPEPGVIHDNDPNFFVKGWLNGVEFADMEFDTGNQTNENGANTGENGIGSLWRHSNPIGIGAIHEGVVFVEGRNCAATGASSFQGRLAEICYYNERLNIAQIIIVNNYLSAKYLSLSLAEDKYSYKQTYGTDVIGIGRRGGSAQRHNRSQGRNPFEISVPLSNLSGSDQFLLTGHNRAPMEWSTVQIPVDADNFRRLRRVWRADRTNWTSGEISFELNKDNLPEFPSGFHKVVLLVDENSPNFPNFALSTTRVLEMYSADGQVFNLDYDLPDGAFYTFGLVRPELNFKQATASTIEGDPPPTNRPEEVEVMLNYTPHPSAATGFTMDYHFVDGIAEKGEDYDYNTSVQSAGVSLAPGEASAVIPFEIITDDDVDVPATRSFHIVLDASGSNTSSGFVSGKQDSLRFFIYDDDAPPVAIFDPISVSEFEGEPGVLLTVRRVGDQNDINSTTSIVRVRLKSHPDQGTATYGVDYTLQSSFDWEDDGDTRAIDLTFLPGVTEQTAFVTFLDDDIDEYNEDIHFELQPIQAISLGDPASIEATVTILDDDPEPEVSFVTNNQQGFSSIGRPIIFVSLDRPSVKDVQVDYEILGASTAVNPTHYNINNPGTIAFPNDSTLMWPLLYVEGNSGDTLSERTVVFRLQNPVNASLGSPSNHTYTIINYSPFEWRGAAGVGKESDNIIWLDADRMSGAHGQAFNTLSNFSPRNINVVQNTPNMQASLQTSTNTINQRKTLHFDGNDIYSVQKHTHINLSGAYLKKSFFFVVRTGSNVDSGPGNGQVIYQQGTNNRGITIYIYEGRFYINAWNTINNDDNTPWGTNSDKRYAYSHPIDPNSNYIVSCHFDEDAEEKLVIYVNGEKGERTETGTCGLLFGDDNDVGLGGILGAARFHIGASPISSGHHFAGYLAEFIKFSEPQLNETRRCIIENYLSAKYNIALSGHTESVVEADYRNASDADLYFGHQAAGIGFGADTNSIHVDAQGIGELRIRNPKNVSANSLMVWGHNGIPLSHSWPYSNANLPSTVLERSGRIWKVFKQGTIDEVDVLFRFSSLENAPAFHPDSLYLLMHTNSDPQDFSNADVIAGNTSFNSGFVAQFENINIPNGAYISLGNTSTMVPLPIELLSFDAKPVDRKVHLYWKTASEINNDFFTVERSASDLIWDEVLRRDGAGNSNTTIAYEDWDLAPLEGWSYYRLKQTDFDGSFTYSEPVAVWIEPEDGQGDIFVYPNPSSTGSFFLRLPAFLQETQVNATLYDMQGRAIKEFLIPAHTDIHELHYGKEPGGMYFISVYSKNYRETQKVIIQH